MRPIARGIGAVEAKVVPSREERPCHRIIAHSEGDERRLEFTMTEWPRSPLSACPLTTQLRPQGAQDQGA